MPPVGPREAPDPTDMQAPLGEINPVIPEHVAEPSTDQTYEAIYDSVDRGRAVVDRTQDPERRARMEQTQAAMEEIATNHKELHEMDRDSQLEVVDRVTLRLFDEDPEVQENIAVIKKARETGREADVANVVTAQRQRFEKLKREVACDLGIELEDVEAQNEEYRAKMIELVSKAGASTEEEIMKSLGFLVYDERAKGYKFNFPENLFPPHIVEKWRRYEGLIGEHQRASMKFDRALDNNSEEITQLDLMRRLSHNSLAKEVQNLLHLEDCDLERCRLFVAKMVEKRFPNIDSRESVLTSESVINHLRVMRALGTTIKDQEITDETQHQHQVAG